MDPLRVASLMGKVAVAARRAGRALVRTDVALVLVARAELSVADQALVILADRHARASPRLLPTKPYDLGTNNRNKVVIRTNNRNKVVIRPNNRNKVVIRIRRIRKIIGICCRIIIIRVR